MDEDDLRCGVLGLDPTLGEAKNLLRRVRAGRALLSAENVKDPTA